MSVSSLLLLLIQNVKCLLLLLLRMRLEVATGRCPLVARELAAGIVTVCGIVCRVIQAAIIHNGKTNRRRLTVIMSLLLVSSMFDSTTMITQFRIDFRLRFRLNILLTGIGSCFIRRRCEIAVARSLFVLNRLRGARPHRSIQKNRRRRG